MNYSVVSSSVSMDDYGRPPSSSSNMDDIRFAFKNQSTVSHGEFRKKLKRMQRQREQQLKEQRMKRDHGMKSSALASESSSLSTMVMGAYRNNNNDSDNNNNGSSRSEQGNNNTYNRRRHEHEDLGSDDEHDAKRAARELEIERGIYGCIGRPNTAPLKSRRMRGNGLSNLTIGTMMTNHDDDDDNMSEQQRHLPSSMTNISNLGNLFASGPSPSSIRSPTSAHTTIVASTPLTLANTGKSPRNVPARVNKFDLDSRRPKFNMPTVENGVIDLCTTREETDSFVRGMQYIERINRMQSPARSAKSRLSATRTRYTTHKEDSMLTIAATTTKGNANAAANIVNNGQQERPLSSFPLTPNRRKVPTQSSLALSLLGPSGLSTPASAMDHHPTSSELGTPHSQYLGSARRLKTATANISRPSSSASTRSAMTFSGRTLEYIGCSTSSNALLSQGYSMSNSGTPMKVTVKRPVGIQSSMSSPALSALNTSSARELSSVLSRQQQQQHSAVANGGGDNQASMYMSTPPPHPPLVPPIATPTAFAHSLARPIGLSALSLNDDDDCDYDEDGNPIPLRFPAVQPHAEHACLEPLKLQYDPSQIKQLPPPKSPSIKSTIQDYKMMAEACNRAGKSRMEALCHYKLGILHEDRGHPTKSISHYKKFLSISQSLRDEVSVCLGLNCLGVIYQKLGGAKFLHKALQCHAKHWEIADTQNKIVAHVNLGLVHRELGQVENAAENYRMAFQYALEIGDKHGESIALANLGLLGLSQGDLLTAQACMERHLLLSESLHESKSICDAYRQLGFLSLQKGDPDTALSMLDRARRIASDMGDQAKVNSIKVNIGVITGELKYEEHIRKIANEMSDNNNGYSSGGYSYSSGHTHSTPASAPTSTAMSADPYRIDDHLRPQLEEEKFEEDDIGALERPILDGDSANEEVH